MPVSKKPRAPSANRRERYDATAPAANLLAKFFQMRSPLGFLSSVREAIMRRIRPGRSHPPTRQAGRPWNARSNARRLRQRLVQHPSVVARFANHPTRAQIEDTLRAVG